MSTEDEGIYVFDLCAALNILSHDYGLYAIKTRLDSAGYRPSPLQRRIEDENEGTQEIYRELEEMAQETGPYDVPEWAETLLARIDAYKGEED